MNLAAGIDFEFKFEFKFSDRQVYDDTYQQTVLFTRCLKVILSFQAALKLFVT